MTFGNHDAAESATPRVANPPLATKTLGYRAWPKLIDLKSSTHAHQWPHIHQLMTANPGECDIILGASAITGEIPNDLVGGSYVLNGPAHLQWGDRITHPFDGHGFIRAFGLQRKDRIRLQCRFVTTPAYQAETKAGRLLYAGIGTAIAPRSKAPWHLIRNIAARRAKNVANTTIYPWGGHWYAGWEGGLPHKLDKNTLETLGEESFNGVLSGGNCLAHTKICHQRNRLLTLSTQIGKNTKLVFREFDSEGHLVHTRAYDAPHPLLLHDFAFTENYYVYVESPLSISFKGLGLAMLGLNELIRALKPARERKAHLVLVPRATEQPVVRIPLAGYAFVMHYANAFEQSANTLVLDAAMADNLEIEHEFGFLSSDHPLTTDYLGQGWRPDLDPRIVRMEVDLKSSLLSVVKTSAPGLEFPRVNPRLEGRASQFIYAAGGRKMPEMPLFDSVVQVDFSGAEARTNRWHGGTGRSMGEPVFAPSANPRHEADGYVLAMRYDTSRSQSELLIFRAQDLGRGPLATVTLPHLLPHGFHGAWMANSGQSMP